MGRKAVLTWRPSYWSVNGVAATVRQDRQASPQVILCVIIYHCFPCCLLRLGPRVAGLSGLRYVILRVCEFIAKSPIFSLNIALELVSIRSSRGIYSQALSVQVSIKRQASFQITLPGQTSSNRNRYRIAGSGAAMQVGVPIPWSPPGS